MESKYDIYVCLGLEVRGVKSGSVLIMSDLKYITVLCVLNLRKIVTQIVFQMYIILHKLHI